MTSFAIKLAIAGELRNGVDAPSPEDLLGQVKDFVDMLRVIEQAMASNGKTSLDWRITAATTNSPITFEVTPYPNMIAANFDRRAVEVERAASRGLLDLARGNPAPSFFTPPVLARAKMLFARVRKRLANTAIHFPDIIYDAPIEIDRVTAERLHQMDEMAAKETPATYRELGSVEGFISRLDRDENGRPILYVRRRLDGMVIKATCNGDAFYPLDFVLLRDVWHGVRVRLFGLLTYEHEDKINNFQVDYLEILDKCPLPTIDDIVDPQFTAGLTSEEYLEEIRRA